MVGILFHSQKMLLLNTSRSLGFDTVSCIGSIAALLRPQPHRWQRYAPWKETHASAPCSVVSWAWIFVATKGVRRSTLLHLCLLDTAILPWRAGLLLANSHCHFSIFQWQMHQVQVCWGSTCPRANPLLCAEKLEWYSANSWGVVCPAILKAWKSPIRDCQAMAKTL